MIVTRTQLNEKYHLGKNSWNAKHDIVLEHL